MMSGVAIERVTVRERDVLWRYLQFYIFELSNYTNTGAVAFWRSVLNGLATYTEAPLARPDGLPRLEQRFVVF